MPGYTDKEWELAQEADKVVPGKRVTYLEWAINVLDLDYNWLDTTAEGIADAIIDLGIQNNAE